MRIRFRGLLFGHLNGASEFGEQIHSRNVFIDSDSFYGIPGSKLICLVFNDCLRVDFHEFDFGEYYQMTMSVVSGHAVVFEKFKALL